MEPPWFWINTHWNNFGLTMEAYLEIIVFFALIVLGYVFGQSLEKSHYRSIIKRESQLRSIPVIASKILPDEFLPCQTTLVSGNVVISVDYFKKFVAGLRSIVGGRITSYESLIDRARREAVLRMKQEARKLNADYVFNIKMETSSISKGRENSIGSVEVLAYGTAVVIEKAKTPAKEPVKEDTAGINFRTA
jgi:uncharacterized protein YbjQ (UPF0145 family)